MKSAEEWVKQTLPFRDEWIKLVKQIQLDAMREGMRRAAQKASAVARVRGVNINNTAHIRQAILSTANSLTEQDLQQ